MTACTDILRGPLRLLVIVLSVAVLASAAIAAVLAVLSHPPAWFMLIFEVPITVAGAFGVLIGRGRFKEGPALALACVAGTVGAGSLLGYLGAGTTLMGVDLRMFLTARLAAAAVLGATAGAIVLFRNPRRSFAALARGIILGGLLAGLLGCLWAARGAIGSMNAVVLSLGSMIVGAIALGLAAASIHYVIRAFDCDRLDNGRT